MRVVNRLAAIVLALVLLAVGLLAIGQTILWAAGRPPWPFPLESWRDRATTTELSSQWVLISAIVLLVVGLGLLIPQLRRPTPGRLRSETPVDERSGDADWWLNRHAVERRTTSAASAVWGVHDVQSHAHGQPGRWRLTVSADAVPGDIQPADVERAVRGELARMSAPADVPVVVSLRHTRRVA